MWLVVNNCRLLLLYCWLNEADETITPIHSKLVLKPLAVYEVIAPQVVRWNIPIITKTIVSMFHQSTFNPYKPLYTKGYRDLELGIFDGIINLFHTTKNTVRGYVV